jgi:23S rRNA pseudouridine1911/1915/1917 synthase
MPLIEKSYQQDLFRLKWSVEPEHENLRLDQFLGLHFKMLSREEIKKKINKGECRISNRPQSKKASSKIKARDIISIDIYKSSNEQEFWRGQEITFETPEEIFEDQEVIVSNKPPYMSTHPTGRHLFHCSTVHYEQKLKLKTAHSIHRLDRETSGVLLLAKNPNAANLLTKEFENNRVKKCYFFIAKKQGVISNPQFLAKERMDNPEEGLKKVIVKYYPEKSLEGKHAETSFNIIKENELYCFGLAFPKTGRTHQIRVHAMANSIPLVGDKLYLGGYPMFQRFKDNVADSDDHDEMIMTRHALHATALQINYKSKKQTFFAKIPNDMSLFIKEHFNIDQAFVNAEIKKRIHEFLGR